MSTAYPSFEPESTRRALEFPQVYEQHRDFVQSSVRRSGVDPMYVDDVVQDIFLVVHRRRRDFEGRSSVKSWIYGISMRVVSDHRRSIRRKRLGREARVDGVELERLPAEGCAPFEALAQAEAARLLEHVLQGIDEERRKVFVFSEVAGMSIPEIAQRTGVNVNTIHTRLRAGRRLFDEGVSRLRARIAFSERRP